MARTALILLMALALGGCAAVEDLEDEEGYRRRVPTTDLICSAQTAVRCTRGHCAPWSGGRRRTMSVTIEMPTRSSEPIADMCVRGACAPVLFDSEGQRGWSWRRHVSWHREHPGQSLFGTIEVHEGWRTFEMDLTSHDNRYIWHGSCRPTLLPQRNASG